MSVELINEGELKALVSLLDDDDSEVSTHVEGKIMSLGTSIIPFLEGEWEKSFNPTVQRRLEDMIHTLQFEQLQERLVVWMNEREDNLLEGLWLVATYQYPDLEYSKLTMDFEQLFVDVWTEYNPDLSPFDQIKMLNSSIFGKLKFSANTKHFHSPANSMINAVLESRKGNPISLCVVYALIAQKLDMPVKGVNLPNLFILTYKTEKLQFYINVFNKGLIFSKEDIDNYVEHLHLVPQESYYQPCANIEIIRRILRNLIVSFDKLGDYHRTDEVKVLLKVLGDEEIY